MKEEMSWKGPQTKGPKGLAHNEMSGHISPLLYLCLPAVFLQCPPFTESQIFDILY